MPPTGELHSWARHLADDVDPIVVERLVKGEPTDGYTAWERREAVRRLRLAGRTHQEIGERIGIDQRQVCRDLERAGLYRVGWQQNRYAAAARRRVISARLYTHGLRTVEVATMLDVAYTVALCDRDVLGFPSAGFVGSRPGRSRDVLLAVYGHLLHDDCQEASA